MLLQRQAEQDRGRRSKPWPTEWTVELGIGVGRPPVQVHRGTCDLAGKRRRPVGRDKARHLLADGTSACGYCRPDTALGVFDLCLRHRRAARHSCDGTRAAISLAQRPAAGACRPPSPVTCRSQASRLCASSRSAAPTAPPPPPPARKRSHPGPGPRNRPRLWQRPGTAPVTPLQHQVRVSPGRHARRPGPNP
ncbi:DUF6233 domain-containing protein [Streptomyces tricolor]|nr:DUF6233 domain-containing protein [Streptomyces tricolor]